MPILKLRFPLLLASASVGRRLLLAQLGIKPDWIISPDMIETHDPDESPSQASIRLATQKLSHVDVSDCLGQEHPRYVMVAGDTIVSVGRRKLGKPADADEAGRYLQLISGRRHRVTSAVAIALCDGKDGRQLWRKVRAARTTVQFKRLSDEDYRAYLQSGEWRGKAGGYDLLGSAQGLIKQVIGAPSTVIGLPLHLTQQLMLGAGVAGYHQP